MLEQNDAQTKPMLGGRESHVVRPSAADGAGLGCRKYPTLRSRVVRVTRSDGMVAFNRQATNHNQKR